MTEIIARETYGILVAPRTVPVLEPIARPSHEAASVLFKVHGTLRTIFIKYRGVISLNQCFYVKQILIKC
jgi:hypothetical protein